MTAIILVTATVIVLCVAFHKISNRIGVPALFAFILLGMVFGVDGIVQIAFEDFEISEQLCSIALIFIMFYGGFGTKWSVAKPVAVKAIALSSLGVVGTALLTGLFCHYILQIGFWESMLIGSVISSTDAASVFLILRSKKLGLKYNTDSLLELESGSNDPFAYMLTVVVLTIMTGSGEMGIFSTGYLIFAQVAYGVGIGFGIAFFVCAIHRYLRFQSAGIHMAFLIGVALFAYALPILIGGNGYLSVYIVGIVLGNTKIPNKQSLVYFFDGFTGLMQMMIFFLLGLLATPTHMLPVWIPSILIALFLTFVARPASVFLILSPMKCKIPQQLLISFAGLRGAASIVFAIVATTHEAILQNDIYHIIFGIVLFSILLQGSLLPFVAKRLGMTDKDIDVLRTFNDYSHEKDLKFIQFLISPQHPWATMKIKEIMLPPSTLVVLVVRGKEHIVPSGKTQLQAGDEVVLSATAFQESTAIQLTEHVIEKDSEWKGKTVAQFSPSADELIIMIKRGGGTIVPHGETQLQEGDVLVINKGTARKVPHVVGATGK